METGQIDAGAFRDGQRTQWNAAAEGWRKWNDLFESAAASLSQRMVELAGVRPGSRVLDVAAGFGEPALTAARVVGPDGHVVATDISAEMLAHGRERAREAGISNVEFVEADASSLDFPEASFDAALSRWGIIFDPDGEGAAARVRGLMKPGARIAIASWGPPDRVPFLAVAMRTAMRRLDVAPPPPGTPGPLSRPTPEALGGLLEGGGFSGIEVEEQTVTFAFASAAEYTTFIKEIAPPVSSMLAPHPPEVQEATWAAITEAAGELAGADGRVVMPNLVLVASGSA